MTPAERKLITPGTLLSSPDEGVLIMVLRRNKRDHSLFDVLIIVHPEPVYSNTVELFDAMYATGWSVISPGMAET